MDIRQAASAFGALAQETRVRLLRLLAATGAAGMRAGDLQSRLAVPASTLSFHLSALEQAGLVQATRQGRQIVYAVRILGLRNLLGFVLETCRGGRAALGADLARLLPLDDAAPTMAPAFNVLFLCTHNSARSIMAEAILQRIGRGRFNAYSAGSRPARQPLPEVIAKLAALSHDVSNLRCKSWDAFTRPDAPRLDFVIALCDTPAGQQSPDFGDKAVTGAWPLPDPKQFNGGGVERAALLHELYFGIRRRLEIFTALPIASLDRMAVKARLDELAGGMPAAV